MKENPAIKFEGPFKIGDLRANKWADVPSDPGAYRWYFPIEHLDILGISSHCDLSLLNLYHADDGMVGLYFGIASNLSQRLKWHSAQYLRLSALESGFLSTYRFSLLALTNTDYLTGEDFINSFIDELKISWIITPTKAAAHEIESVELAGQFHYPINIQNNNKPEIACFVQYLRERRRAYKVRYLKA